MLAGPAVSDQGLGIERPHALGGVIDRVGSFGGWIARIGRTIALDQPPALKMLPFGHQRIGDDLRTAAIVGIAGGAQDRDQRPLAGARGIGGGEAGGGRKQRLARFEPVDPVMLDDEGEVLPRHMIATVDRAGERPAHQPVGEIEQRHASQDREDIPAERGAIDAVVAGHPRKDRALARCQVGKPGRNLGFGLRLCFGAVRGIAFARHEAMRSVERIDAQPCVEPRRNDLPSCPVGARTAQRIEQPFLVLDMGLADGQREQRIERRRRNVADNATISGIAVLIGILLHRVTRQHGGTDCRTDLGVDAGDERCGEQDMGHEVERGDRLDDFGEALGD